MVSGRQLAWRMLCRVHCPDPNLAPNPQSGTSDMPSNESFSEGGLAMAGASRVIMVGGLAATFSESIAMARGGNTSALAETEPREVILELASPVDL